MATVTKTERERERERGGVEGVEGRRQVVPACLQRGLGGGELSNYWWRPLWPVGGTLLDDMNPNPMILTQPMLNSHVYQHRGFVVILARGR